MRHGVGKVQKERFVPMRPDERHRLFCVSLGHGVLVHGAFELDLVAHEWHLVVLDFGAEICCAIVHAVR